MAEKNSLPEINIGEGAMVEKAAELVKVKTELAQLETREKQLRKDLADIATGFRDGKLDQAEPEIIGMIRVTNEEAPVRVEFRVDRKKAVLAIEDEDNLNDLFGSARPLLFGVDTIVNEITDPEGLITAMQATNRNPWDFLALSVKSGMDTIVAEYPQAVSNKAYMPKKGFLGILKDIWHTLGAEAKGYAKTYIKHATKASVNGLTKGKK